MKHLFIVNPVAGGHDCTPEIIAEAAEAFAGRDVHYEIYTTTAPMDACEKIKTEAARGEELRIYACGGKRSKELVFGQRRMGLRRQRSEAGQRIQQGLPALRERCLYEREETGLFFGSQYALLF